MAHTYYMEYAECRDILKYISKCAYTCFEPAFPHPNGRKWSQIWCWGSPQVDMFAAWLNNQLLGFCIPGVRPTGIGIRHLEHELVGFNFYIFPPPFLLSRLLTNEVHSPCRVSLIAPVWAVQAWLP